MLLIMRTAAVFILLAFSCSAQQGVGDNGKAVDLAGMEQRINTKLDKAQGMQPKDWIAPGASLLVAVLAIYASLRTTQLSADLARDNKTKELLFQTVVNFAGHTQPRSAVLGAIKALGSGFHDLRPFFLEFVVKQAEHLGAKGEDNDAERSNIRTILDVFPLLEAGSAENLRVKAAFSGQSGTKLDQNLRGRVDNLKTS